jgi:hypothetical protein
VAAVILNRVCSEIIAARSLKNQLRTVMVIVLFISSPICLLDLAVEFVFGR